MECPFPECAYWFMMRMMGPWFVSVTAPAVTSHHLVMTCLSIPSTFFDKMLRLIVNLNDAAITSSDSTIGTLIDKGACHIQVTSGGNAVSSEVYHFLQHR